MAYLIFTEDKLSSKERNSLEDTEFGIPELRKYPLNDKTHVLSAIRFFNHCPPKYEKQLAMRIIKKMEYYNIPKESIGKNNRLRKYI